MIGWLSLTVWIPLLAALAVMLFGRTPVVARGLALVATGFSLLGSVILYLAMARSPEPGFRLVEELSWIPQLGIQYKLGLDGLSAPMILLCGIICFTACWMSSEITHRQREFYALALTAMTGAFGVFASLDLFFLILFYELASIPMFFLVGIWGSDKLGDGRTIHHEKAAMKLLLYLQLGGALVLLGIFGLYFAAGQNSFDLTVLMTSTLSAAHQKALFFLFFVGFGIEAGLVPLHTWLPEGHSSAPTPLSMLLAGVLLKMGGYGILRLGVQLLPEGAAYWMQLFVFMAVLNVLYGGLCALRQTDVKVMIAYSSVSHMGMVFWGVACINAPSMVHRLYGLNGAVMQMFSHGVITALLFAIAGTVYHITHSRNLRSWGGLAVRMPCLASLYVLAAMASLGLPGMTGFAAELMVFLGAWGTDWKLVLLTVPGLVITTTYLLRSVQYGFYGPLNPQHQGVQDVHFRDAVPMLLLAATTLFFGVLPQWIVGVANPTIQSIAGKFGP